MKRIASLFCGIIFFLGCPAFSQMNAVITGKLPQLAFSNGTDRLGSAKMGYIDTGIIVKITDSINGNYRLQLSKYHSAFLAREFLRPTADTLPAQPALMDAWSVRGGEKYDTVSIGISRSVPYASWMETAPAAIMIQLFGVQSNTNWITNLSSAKGIKDVSWQQTEDDVVQIKIELQQHQQLGYSIGYIGNRLVLSIKRKPEHAHVHDFVVAIDAGHGGTNTGASGVKSNVLEKNYTILFAKELEKLLEKKNIRTIMVRTGDTTIENKDRLLFLKQQHPDLLISFHLNSSSRPSARGVSTYYRHVGFRQLSQSILKQMLEIDNLPEFGNVGSFNFQLVQPTEFPACLVEVAFLSNEQDEQMILDKSFREKVAHKVYDGIVQWLHQLD